MMLPSAPQSKPTTRGLALCPSHLPPMPYISTVGPESATGKLARQYEASSRRDRRVAGIIQVMSQNPDALDDLMRLYARIAYGPSGLSRAQREMVAIVVSRVNECRY